MPIPRSYFQTDPRTAAKSILGATLIHGETSGRIVETEAYSTVDDPACHTAFRNQAREFVETEREGAAYIYLNYGVYHLLNILTKDSNGELGFVLIRALEPLEGITVMQNRRNTTKLNNLCSGPGKLSIALAITPDYHRSDLCSRSSAIQLRAQATTEDILTGPRIGITKAADFPWRFGLASPHLSRPFPKTA